MARRYTCFELEIVDRVAQLRMIRPERANSMIPEFWDELPEIVNRISDEALARVVVLSAEGRNFCSGMDLGVFTGEGGIASGEAATSAARRNAVMRAHVLHLQESITCLERARVPVLAAVQGACVGGGLDLVTACDVRYATEDAFFCVQEINIGMTADVGTLQRLPRLVPEGVARELAYTGRRMPAARAAQVGLVNQVFATHDEMLTEVSAIAAEIAEKSPLAVLGTKETLNYGRDHTVAEGLEFIAGWQAGMFDPADMAEAFRARQERRAPSFPDLPPARKGL